MPKAKNTNGLLKEKILVYNASVYPKLNKDTNK